MSNTIVTMILKVMPKRPDDYGLTEQNIDMIVEDVSGKPVKPKNLAEGIASMRWRVAQLEAEKVKLLDRMDEDDDESLNEHLGQSTKASPWPVNGSRITNTQFDSQN